MGHRLSKIYTRTGDDGTTGLANGERVDKCDDRVEAFGTVDETNSALGLLLAEPDLPIAIRASLTRIQHELFELGAELSLPGYRQISAEHVTRLERELDALNDELPPLKEFVLPGGNRAAAICHVARTICRRAERRAFAVAKIASVNAELLRYLNRLSDLLFVMARRLARLSGGEEVLWQREPK
ncbi:MAG TPA: cob(I)yrinic acid a,c-diamide adenosyltransferase [Gammaproteobacteria bacterium]|nr:cob(I)yrinic acid a,c-diamide adenosyltransferase [Gammaproteobacteria bacterium]